MINDDDGEEEEDEEDEIWKAEATLPIINPPWSLQFAVAFAIRPNSSITGGNPSIVCPICHITHK